MRIVDTYSFNGGKEIAKRHSHILRNVHEIVRAVKSSEFRKTKHAKGLRQTYNLRALSQAFSKGFKISGWETVRVRCTLPTTYYLKNYKPKVDNDGAYRQIDFVKGKLGLEVQFGKPIFEVCSICAKMTIFRNLGFIECGIEIVPVKALALEMSSGVSYFEQFVWDLESRGVADIDIPVLILGIDI